MYRTLLATVIGALALSAAVHAQPSAQEVVDRSMQAYASMMEDVESYQLTLETMGHEQQLYFERREGDDPFAYRAYTVTPRGVTAFDDHIPFAGEMAPGTETFQRLRERARLLGRQTLDGQQVYAIAVDDPAGLMEMPDMPDDADFEVDSATFFISSDHYLLVGADMEGRMRHRGQENEVTMEMRASDFRTVGSVRFPFHTVMRMDGLAAGMSEEERQQLAEVRRQLEQLPPEQRAMMEQAMGDQLEQMRRMAEGESVEMEMRVLDLQINVPRPG